jgi:hypothetical protein
MAKSITNGTAAEYYVAAELTRLGFQATMTIKNAPGIDILAVNSETDKMSCIQVKSKDKLGKTKSWLLHEKDEKVREGNFFYVFVDLNAENGDVSGFYIVPATVVAQRISEYHKKFLENDGKDTNMRTFILNEEEEKKYQNWDILK